MPNQMRLNQDHKGSPGPRGLVIRSSGTDQRFGLIHYGVSADRESAGVWGDNLPLVVIPERAKDLAWNHAKLPVTLEADGQVGRIDQPHGGCLNPMPLLSRRARAVHVDVADRHYEYFRRWFHVRLERDGVGEVVRHRVGTFSITDQADAIDVAVGLLTARVIGFEHISVGGVSGPIDPIFKNEVGGPYRHNSGGST